MIILYPLSDIIASDKYIFFYTQTATLRFLLLHQMAILFALLVFILLPYLDTVLIFNATIRPYTLSLL